MEVAFTEEIESLKLGAGDVFHGEGILAVTKALLQSGVAYVGGYQGAPVSHLLDVMVQARELMDELGVHVEACTNEASAAAMLGASINYPVRGAVTWKSIVGTNVAADALSNLSSPGVKGGALIIVGEDFGEGASVIQERTHAYALKSSIWLLDPRPALQNIVRMVEQGFELSEASNTPVFLELRIRACHVRGSFICNDNRRSPISTRTRLAAPAGFDYDRLAHPPATFVQEKLKADVRLPAARRFIVERQLNEIFEAERDDLGIIVQGGLFNNLVRALQKLGLADGIGRPAIPVLCLNVVHPLVPEQIDEFCRGRAVLIVEEGQPEYLEQAIASILRRAGNDVRLHGKDMLPMAGELDTEAILRGLLPFMAEHGGENGALASARARLDALAGRRQAASASAGGPVPPRPPTFCIGCPERPVFSALKQVRETVGPTHYAADIGCHAFATFAPFSMGNSILGYGMSLASAAGVSPLSDARPLAVMGDGGFWHNGLLSGVVSNLLNQGDGVLMIMKNGYTSATGTQEVISTPGDEQRQRARETSATHTERTIENTLRGLGVRWLRTVHTYRVTEMKRTLTDAFTDLEPGLKVVIAEGECQLERQRRLRPMLATALERGERTVKTRFGIDANVCSGDHACIRISGCPALGVADSGDPLKPDPVAQVSEQCVGCGLCGENAHAATLCPSFYRTEWVRNPGRLDLLRDRLSRWLRGRLATGAGSPPSVAGGVRSLERNRVQA
ncbi:MAG: indolepyruvate ferredoxin oxidoreductase subunit alpha [Burkholderiaceae bacterium]